MIECNEFSLILGIEKDLGFGFKGLYGLFWLQGSILGYMPNLFGVGDLSSFLPIENNLFNIDLTLLDIFKINKITNESIFKLNIVFTAIFLYSLYGCFLIDKYIRINFIENNFDSLRFILQYFKYIHLNLSQPSMSKQEYMKFGQIVRIHGHRLGDQNDNKRGMIVAKGFTDPDARYMTFQTFRNCSFYRQSLFQILPKGIFQSSSISPTQQQIRKLHQNYQTLIQEKMGDIIKFGEDVVFKHVDSQQYLSGSVRCSEGGLGAFKIQLTHELQKNLVFKLYPFRSFQKQGDKIKLQSPLRIKNMENRCYISHQKSKSGGTDEDSEEQSKFVYNIVTTYSQSYTWLFHLHQSEQTLSNIEQIKTHDIILLRYTKNQGYLCLDRTNQKNFSEPLKAMVRLPLQQTGYPCYTCLWQIQKQPIPAISPYPDSKRGTPDTYTLRDILTCQYLKVLPFQKQNQKKDVVGKSFDTKLDQEQITIKSAKGLTNIEEFIKNNGLVKISGPKQTALIKGGEIDVQDYPVNNQQQFQFRQKEPASLWSVKFLSGDGEHGFRIEKIDQKSKQQVLFIISTYEVLDQFGKQLQMDTQTFQKKIKAKRFDFIDQLLKKLIVFIKQCSITDIEQDTLPNKKKQFIAKDLKICDKLFKILEHMGVKILEQIYKKDKSENDAFKRVFNRAYYLILQIIKDNPVTKLYVCEDWLQIILNHAIQNEEERVHQTLKQILQSNQLVVAKFLKANNCHLIARIINVFTLKPPHEKFLNIFSASCMSNGSPIVSNQKLILDYFFQKLTMDASFTFVKIKGHQGMSLDVAPDPEKLYLKCSISKDQHRVRTLKDFFEESSRLDLSQTSNYFISYLNLLADICFGRNTQAKNYVEKILAPDTSQYYQDQLQKKHNEQQVQKFDALYTLNYILQDKSIESVRGYKTLLRAVLRVINYAFVQSADQNPVLKIKRYRNIDKIQEQQDQQSGKFERLRSVMDFVKQKVQNFRSFYDQPEEEQKQQNLQQDEKTRLQKLQQKKIMRKQRQLSSIQEKQFLLTQLILLKSTLMIGYWKVHEQQNLLRILLKVLTNSKKTILHYKEDIDTEDKERNQFDLFKQEARRRTPSVQLITSCKALVCELIQLIFDFRHDDLVTQCVKAYKQMSQKFMFKFGGHKIIMDDQLNIDRGDSDDYGPQLYNIQEWKKKLSSIFDHSSDNSDSEQNIMKTQDVLVPLMIELGIHQNPILFFRSLQILKRFFEYRNQILGLFLNLSLYDSQSGEYLENQISKKRKQLNTLEEQNLLYAQDKADVYNNIMEFLVWLSEAIKNNFHLQDRPDFRKFNNIFDHFHQKSQINQFHQSAIKNMDLHPVLLSFISLSRQPLSSYSDSARTVLKYVYRFLALLCKGYNQAKMQIYRTKKISSIIKKHIKEDVSLVQKYGVSDTKVINVNEIKKRKDCEAITLLAEMYSHNKFILFNQQDIDQTSQQICSMINQLNLDNYYKSHLLDFCRSMIYFRDQKIQLNQSRILARLQDPKKQRIYYRVLQQKKNADSSQLIQYIKNLLQQFQEMNPLLKQLGAAGQLSNHTDNIERDMIISPQLTYFITLFNLFANLVEGKHIVNIGKGQQVHSYQMLMTILGFSELCYPLKTTVRNYINQLYYSTQVQEDLYNLIIKFQLPLMIKDLNRLITILIKDVNTRYSIAHPVRYRYYETYIFLYVQQILLSLNYLFCQSDSQFFKSELKKELSNNYSRGYYYLHYFVIRIYQRLRWLTEKYYDHHYLRGLLNMISNKIRVEFLQQFEKTAFRIFDRDQQKKHEFQNFNPNQIQQKEQMHQMRQAALMKRCRMYLHKLVKGDIGDFFIKQREQKDLNFPLTFTLPYEDKKDDNDAGEIAKKQKQMESLAYKLKTMLFPNLREQQAKINHILRLQTLNSELSDNIGFNNFLQSYMIKNCKQLYNVDQYSLNVHKFITPFVNFSEYIKIFVQVNSQKPQSIPNQLRIFFFNLILWYIQQERRDFVLKKQQMSQQEMNYQISKPIQKWGKQDWEDVAEQIKNNQEFLADALVAQLIISSLKYTQDLNLYAAIFKFCIAYLLGGNNHCQNTLLEILKTDQKNIVFVKLEKIIARLGKRITSRIAERTNRIVPAQDQFVVQPLDQYDYYDDSIKGMKKFQSLSMPQKEEQQQQILQKQVFGMIFRFLQLLCECNNIQLKNFVREQINPDGEKKGYSFNLINVAIFEIRRLFKVMHKQASGVIGPLIDFVNEVVTIPCLQNQKSLCQTTFFDDLCYMSSFFSDKNNVINRGFRDFRDPSYQPLNNVYKQCILIILNVLQSSQYSLIKQLLLKVKPRFLLDIIKQNLLLCNIRTKQDFSKIVENQIQIQPKVHPKIQQAMNVVIVLSKLEDCEGSDKFKEQTEAFYAQLQKSQEQQNNIQLKELVKCLRNQMLKIEIISNATGKTQLVYFPDHPILKTLSPSTRDRIMFQVSRTTQRQKIRSLFGFRQQIIAQIKHNFEIQKEKLLGIIPYKPANIMQLQNYLFNLSFVINGIWFYSTDVIIEYSEIIYLSPAFYRMLLFGLDIVQLIIAVLYFLSYFKCQYALAQFRANQASQGEGEEEENKEGKSYVVQHKSLSDKIIGIVMVPISYIILLFNFILNFVQNTSIGILFRFDQKFSYVFLYLMASIFGTFYSQPIFLMYVLFFFMKNDTLSNVFNAIVYTFGQLVSVGTLGFVFLYVFCLVFYETYSIEIMSSAGDDACYTIYGCLLDLFVSGTIGGDVQDLQLVRFTTDMIYFIFFGVFFGNIVQTIMINAFSDLRKQKDDMNDDKKNRCYICGKDRATLQKSGDRFEIHIKSRHFLWNYIFYTYCLQQKHETDYSGLEYQIKKCLESGQGQEENKIIWIPFDTDKEQDYNGKIIQLEEHMINITEKTKEKIQALKAKKQEAQQANNLMQEMDDQNM